MLFRSLTQKPELFKAVVCAVPLLDMVRYHNFQIAKLWGAKPVMGTSGVSEKLDALAVQGLDRGINYRTENFAEAVLAATNGAGVDVVIDHVGGAHFHGNLQCMALRGRLVSVGRLGGKMGELDLDFLALRRLQLIGVTFRTRTLEERIAVTQRLSRVVRDRKSVV